MRLRDLNGKTVCLLGFGREGQATLEAIERHAPQAEVTIADERTDLTVPEKHWTQMGPSWLQNLEKFDVIIRSPGVFPRAEFDAVEKKITNAMQIFLEEAKAAGSIVVGVTGSKGKSTTATLIHRMLLEAGDDTFLVGNIGSPALNAMDQAKEGTIFVTEMSSYQLQLVTLSPQIAVITSFFPEHLDYHGSVDSYRAAKERIVRFQNPFDVVFYDGTSDGAAAIAAKSHGRRIPFSADACPVKADETKLRGEHNRSNMGAATLVAQLLGTAHATCEEVCRVFEGLPHRLQSLGVHHKIEWIDDAISTTPQSTIAALDALGGSVRTVILGGQDRGVDFSPLVERIITSKVKTVILFPGSGPRIREALEQAKAKVTVRDASSMDEAVTIAREVTPAKAICLLSTASPSYGMFKDFEEKGRKFQEAIHRT